MKQIEVDIKVPGGELFRTKIDNTLEALQEIVDGRIETVTLLGDLVVICNEESRLRRLPHNCKIGGVNFYGTIILAGIEGDEFTDCPLFLKSCDKGGAA